MPTYVNLVAIIIYILTYKLSMSRTKKKTICYEALLPS